MANAIDFPERNDWMGKPEETSNNQVYALPVCRILTWMPGVIPRAKPVQVHAHISCWEISDEEFELMVQDREKRKIYLKIWGTSMYPSAVFAGFFPVNPDHPDFPDKIFTEEEVNSLKKR